MKHALGLVSALAIMFGAAGAADAQVRILGRSELSRSGGFTVQWPSSGFEARLEGSLLEATIEDYGDNWLNVEVDGKVTRLDLQPGVATYTLFAGEAGSHAIRVTRRTGSPSGPTRIVDIRSDGVLQPPPAPARRILVIGDSITSGYGIEGANQTCSFSHATQNADLAYPALVARAFGADLHSVSIDGRGLIRNYAGDDPAMSLVAWRTLPGATAKWPLAAYEPQVIVVNLGTNDFAAGDPGDGFDHAYIGMLARLRAAYPEARIYAAFGPMLEGAAHEAAKASIRGAVEELRRHHDTRVTFVEFPQEVGGRRFGCDWHPGMDAHKAMAHRLGDLVRRDLGWTPAAGGGPGAVPREDASSLPGAGAPAQSLPVVLFR
jgi:lysophospholipase L1-like esterase